MDRRVIITAILIAMLSVVFSMSGDGGNVPVVPKESTVKVTENAIQKSSSETDQIGQTKSNETIKDRLGIDTGLTKEKLDDFKDDYNLKFRNLFPNFSESASDWFFNCKINLNKIEDFEKFGLELKKTKDISTVGYKENSLKSDIIVTGKVVELIQTNENNAPRYKFEIDQIIKGSEIIKKYLGDLPNYIYFVAILGVSIDNESVLNKKGIYFFQIDSEIIKHSLFLKRYYSTVLLYNDSIVCYERDINKFDTAFRYKHRKLELSQIQKDNNYEEKYLNWYEECKIGSWDETIVNIRKILEINDEINFYKRSYKYEEK